MRSKHGWGRILLTTFALIGALTACGRFGEKTDLSKLLEYAPDGAGCLNELGPRFERYFEGRIEKPEWEATWDCATDTITLFKEFVRGGDQAGYTRKDIHTLVSDYLLTEKTISRELIDSAFELKATLLGGNKDLLTVAELDRFVELLKIGKRETTALLPHLQKRSRSWSATELREFANALERMTSVIASELKTQGNPAWSWQSLEVMTAELQAVHGWKFPTDLVRWLKMGKRVLFAGRSEGIEAELVPELFRMAGTYGATALIIANTKAEELKGPNAQSEFYLEMARRAQGNLHSMFVRHGGAIPLSLVDEIIDFVPGSWLMDIQTRVIKLTLRPVLKNLLWSQNPEAFDEATLDFAISLFEKWVRGKSHLERIYDQGLDPTGVDLDAFVNMAASYAERLDQQGKQDVDRLIGIAKTHRPLFALDENRITFVNKLRYSLHHLSQMHWIRLVAEHVLRSYSSHPDKDKGTVGDLKRLVDDYTEIGFALGVIDPTIQGLHEKRFREANLFLFVSNGDEFMDLAETTEYIAFLFSAGVLSDKILNLASSRCPGNLPDPLGTHWMTARCFRREYYRERNSFWYHFPELVAFFNQKDPRAQVQVLVAMEQGARRYGFSERPVGGFDIDGMAGILHFLEALLERYDDDNSQFLNLDELMRGYPVFKRSLAEFGQIDPSDDGLLKAVLTYTVHHEKAPTRDLKGIAHFLWWRYAMRPFWKKVIKADRMKLYKVISVLSVPEVPAAGTVQFHWDGTPIANR